MGKSRPDSNVEADPLMRERPLHAIVPRGSVAGTALTLVIAIMSFLASLTLGAVTLVNDTAQSWQNDIAREVTIQLRPLENMDMEAALLSARQIAGSYPGVTEVRVIDQASMNALLAPWLGEGLDLAELPVPHLVTVGLNPANPPDLAALRKELEDTVPGASLDDHRGWVDRLTAMARATIAAGIVIFVLVMAATVLTVVFATRGAMAGSAHIIEVLHFVGAEQRFIAGEFQRHFLLLGLKGGLAGGALGILVFLVTSWWLGTPGTGPAADQASALFGDFTIGPAGYIGVVFLVFAVALLTAATSRFTVLRHVGALDGRFRTQPTE